MMKRIEPALADGRADEIVGESGEPGEGCLTLTATAASVAILGVLSLVLVVWG